MLIQSALYYPYINIRNETWLKAAALYWKSVHRIVPHGFPTDDSRTVKVLQDGLGFILDQFPGQSAVDASGLFIDLLADRGRELRQKLQVQPSIPVLRSQRRHPVDGGISDSGTIGYIYAEKLGTRLIDALREEGLAVAAPTDSPERGGAFMPEGSAGWIGMDSRLAAAYMTVLARFTANHFDLCPVTDERIAHVAMDDLSVDAVANTILGIAQESGAGARGNLHHRIALLAIESVIPRALGRVSAEEIVSFRRRHDDLLGSFQTSVAEAVHELRDISSDIDPRVLQERIIEVTNSHLIRPRAELERALRLWGLEPSTDVLAVAWPAGTTAASLASGGRPIIAAATGAAVGVATFIGRAEVRRRNLRKANGGANYLLTLGAGLTPTAALAQQLRSFVGR